MSGYYVMNCVDGDECLLYHTATYGEAETKLTDFAAVTPDPDLCLSIWAAGGAIAAVWRRDLGITVTPRGYRMRLQEAVYAL
jgi:hypothetical protein